MEMTDYTRYHEYRDNDKGQKKFRLPKYFLKVLPEDKNISILDIGCGNGDILYALKMRGYNNLQGIDLDPYAVECCKGKGIACEQIDILNFMGRLSEN